MEYEHSVKTAVKKLRQALGDDADTPRYVETLPRRGYRFIYPVDVQPELAPASQTPPAVPVMAPQAAAHWAAVGVAGAVVIMGALLIHWFTSPFTPSPQLTEQRLTFNPGENLVLQGRISPDGKYLAYSDQMGLHVKLIPSGEILNIPQPDGPGISRAYWYPNGWFPDGTRFLASNVASNGGSVTGWVVSVMGGPPRKLGDDIDPWAVSPDGRLIAFGTGAAFIRDADIGLMGPEGEEPHTFVSGSQDDALFFAAWSPSGQRIAYGRFRRKDDTEECSIESRDLKGVSQSFSCRIRGCVMEPVHSFGILTAASFTGCWSRLQIRSTAISGKSKSMQPLAAR